jgi:GAF domain-containing protein
VGRAAASILELETLAHQVVELVRERFDLYYAGLFLLDGAGENAVLVAGSGEAGRIMKERGHKLGIGGMSMVGAACAQRRARIALDVGAEPIRFDNPLLPQTRSEMALPLLVGDRVLGAIDVQSAKQAAFSKEDIAVLQLVADQVAVAVENARKFSAEAELLEATSPLFRVGRRLVSAVTMDEIVQTVFASGAETEADGCVVGRLTDVPVYSAGEPAYSAPVRDVTPLGGWNRHGILDAPVPRHDYPLWYPGGGLQPQAAAGPLPVEMLSRFLVMEDITRDPRAAESLRSYLAGIGQTNCADPSPATSAVTSTRGGTGGDTPRADAGTSWVASPLGGVVNVPLRVAGQVIGFVTIYRAGAGPFSPVSIRLYEALADQAAVAIERQRLLDEARSRADGERLISQVTARMRESLDVRRVLETAVDEIYQALGLDKVVIRLEAAGPEYRGEARGDNGGDGETEGISR